MLKFFKVDPAKLISALGLARQADFLFKKTEVKSELLTDIDMLLMIEKGIKGEIANSINRYAKASNKYLKDYDKNKESSYLKFLNIGM